MLSAFKEVKPSSDIYGFLVNVSCMEGTVERG